MSPTPHFHISPANGTRGKGEVLGGGGGEKKAEEEEEEGKKKLNCAFILILLSEQHKTKWRQ